MPHPPLKRSEGPQLPILFSSLNDLVVLAHANGLRYLGDSISDMISNERSERFLELLDMDQFSPPDVGFVIGST